MKKSYIVIVIIFLAGLSLYIYKDMSQDIDEGTLKVISNNMKLTSPVFDKNGFIPSKYTCDGININPPLSISEVPTETKSLVLIMEDPDAVKSTGRIWDHWVIFNIPPEVSSILEGQEPLSDYGVGTGGNTKYSGPCPPDGEHRYFFKLYALDTLLELELGATKQEVIKAMRGNIIDTAELIGIYNRI